MAELAEGARLLSECGGKLPPRVRIPLSPPHAQNNPLVYHQGVVFLPPKSTFPEAAIRFFGLPTGQQPSK